MTSEFIASSVREKSMSIPLNILRSSQFPSLTGLVFVYRNLHKNCWSVKDIKSGLVLSHTKRLILRQVMFQVSERVRDRIRETGRKEIHAGAIGYISNARECNELDDLHYSVVSYNPYVNNHFVCEHPPASLPLTIRRGQVQWSCDFADFDIEDKDKVLAIWKRRTESGLSCYHRHAA